MMFLKSGFRYEIEGKGGGGGDTVCAGPGRLDKLTGRDEDGTL
jgi:hypothetical protein